MYMRAIANTLVTGSFSLVAEVAKMMMSAKLEVIKERGHKDLHS